ncbi:MAG TPA: pantetheine-phosphate adenylyltransferase [Candidatus Sulfotelmatobacter sp.]|nr:pantetheine-phosphate adenylyltransferase [Candidatus Sulfotelmatobacter sp.]
MNKGTAVYPGSFDPPTNGHLDLIERGSKIFQELVVAILRNPEKSPMFSLAERLDLLKTLTAHLSNVRIDTFDGLMVEYAKSIDAMCVLRGIRAISDYEYELQMALMNRKLEPTLETVFMMPADKYSYVSSRLVREVAMAGGPVRGLVPEVVEQKLREKVDPAYKLQGAELVEVTLRRERKKRKKA